MDLGLILRLSEALPFAVRAPFSPRGVPPGEAGIEDEEQTWLESKLKGEEQADARGS